MASYVSEVIDKMSSKQIETDYKLVKVRGVPQNPTFDEKKFEEVIDTFETRDGDVFIATFVKAGTTWTQQIVHLLLRGGEPGGFYGESVPWLESVTSEFLGPREAPTWTLDKINSAASPRYFKTHATVEHLPKGHGKIKTIVVARNPKDSVVSLYHHAKSKPEFGFTGDFNQFCEIFLAGQAENGCWFTHILGWYNKTKAEPDSHLFLKYEEMCQDPAAAVKAIATFLNLSASDEVVEKVVRNASITEMRATSSIGLNHLRKGGYGGWRTMFSVAMSEFFDDVYQYKFRNTDLKFNFGPNSHGQDIIM
jgi:hypothetical protein